MPRCSHLSGRRSYDHRRRSRTYPRQRWQTAHLLSRRLHGACLNPNHSQNAMPKRIAVALLLIAILPLLPFRSESRAVAPEYDLAIINGRILDGTGNPWFTGSVAIKGDRI